MLYSMGLVEQEGIVLNQLPTIVICWVHNANSPGQHDDDFGGVKTLKLFEVPNGLDNLCGCGKKIWELVVCHAFESNLLAVLGGYHPFKGSEI